MGEKRAPRTERIDEFRLLIPKQGEMRTEGLVFAGQESGAEAGSLVQVANVAALPGIVGRSLALPDVHQGYGFPIGGVAAFDPEGGVVSPGGVGYDINCGVRLYTTALSAADVRGELDRILDAVLQTVPTGVGGGRGESLKPKAARGVLEHGAGWAVSQGYGERGDLDRIEDRGVLPADPDAISRRAVERGSSQLGSLGSGNHFVELGRVVEIYDQATAAAFGLEPDGLTVMIHTGSRGLGHQVCDDFIRKLSQASAKYGLRLPDRQLACAPVNSPEGQRYLGAMGAAANFAFANRQVIGHHVREALEQALGMGPAELRLRLVYDLCHNIAKLEEHEVDGQKRRLCVHRKGATRALPPGDARLPEVYRATGQPVLVPGDMGRASYVLVGRPGAAESFYSACHGAGRIMSRQGALRAARGRSVLQELTDRGIRVRAARRRTVVEEMPDAYRDVSQVAAVVEGAGLASRVARLEPLAVIKG
ncbi:MAG: RtcB family protein [bacterium]